MSGDADAADRAGIEELADLGERERRLPVVSLRTWAFLAATAVLAAAFVYDYEVLGARDPIVFGWNLAAHEWLFVLSLLVFGFYVVVPLAMRPGLSRRYWRQLRRNPLGLASFVYLVGAFVVGMVGPAVLGTPTSALGTAPYQPPVWVGIDKQLIPICSGPVAGGKCYGTWAHPFGTTGNSQDVLVYVANNLRVALEVGFISAMLLIPIATAVGTAAAEFGGWVDEVLMRYVDLQQVVPAFFVYIVAQYVFEPRLTMMLAIFGLLSWGSIARMVRSEAIQKREQEYVLAAESAGASRLSVVRRHLAPNVANTVVTAVTLQIPTLILIEAALSYLALGDPNVYSFGWFISSATNTTEFPVYWWLSVIPTAFLFLTIVALNLFGDALRDVLDPRLER